MNHKTKHYLQWYYKHPNVKNKRHLYLSRKRKLIDRLQMLIAKEYDYKIFKSTLQRWYEYPHIKKILSELFHDQAFIQTVEKSYLKDLKELPGTLEGFNIWQDQKLQNQ